jgi:hypothetical protein
VHSEDIATKSNKDPNIFAKNVFDSLLDKLDPAAEKETQSEPEGKDPVRQGVRVASRAVNPAPQNSRRANEAQ